MAKTSKDVEYQNVTVRIPKQLYAEYKKRYMRKLKFRLMQLERICMMWLKIKERKRIMATKKDTQPAKLVS